MTANTTAIRMPVHVFHARGRYVKLTLTGNDDGCWPCLSALELFADGFVPPGQQYTNFRSSSGGP
jgi:hypothetical protein